MRIAVAMSGGVDSSVAAALLQGVWAAFLVLPRTYNPATREINVRHLRIGEA